MEVGACVGRQCTEKEQAEVMSCADILGGGATGRGGGGVYGARGGRGVYAPQSSQTGVARSPKMSQDQQSLASSDDVVLESRRYKTRRSNTEKRNRTN